MDDIKRNVIRRGGIGQCPMCGNNMYVIQKQQSVIELNEDGTMKRPIAEKEQEKAVCTYCGYRVPIIRIGLYYVPNSGFYSNYVEKLLSKPNSLPDDNPFIK